MNYPNSEMISTYDGCSEGKWHRCNVLLRDNAIVVEYVDDKERTTYMGTLTGADHYGLRFETDNYVYTATLVRVEEDLLEGHWQESSYGAANSGTWSIELAQ